MKNKLFAVSAVFSISAVLMPFCMAHAQVDTMPPTIPTGISASLLSSGQVYISWGSSIDNGVLTGYYLYRNGQQISNIPGYTFYTDTPAPGSYSYSVSAYDAEGNVSGQSGGSPFITVLPDPTPPSAPTGLAASVSSSSIMLSWESSSDNVMVVGYYVSRNGARIQTPDPITGNNFLDTGLNAGATVNYSVVAYDAAGNVSNASLLRATTIFDITPPSVPQNPVAVATSPSTINFSWQPSTDNIQVGGYNIYRDGSFLATVAASPYPDGGLAAQSTHFYTVNAYDELGNTSVVSRQANATTQPADLTLPTVPKYFNAIALSASSVLLTWTPSTDNVQIGGYYLYRNGAQFATTASSSYLDTGLATSTTYEYAVNAYDTSNNVSAYMSAAVTTLSYDPVTPGQPVTPVPPVIIPTPPDIPPTSPSPPITTPPQMSINLTTNLSYGSRNVQVTALQTFLIQNNYLGPSYATGFFGSLTQGAVQQFQCAQNIVCSGNPASTGWGSVGPRTRAAINAF